MLPDVAEADVPAYMAFPKEHRAKSHSMDEIDRLLARYEPVIGDRALSQSAAVPFELDGEGQP